MITWILTLMDVISFISLTFINFEWDISIQFALLPAFYLIGKAAFFRDIMSIIDGVCGLYMILAFLLNITQSFFYYMVLIWFAYKIISTAAHL